MLIELSKLQGMAVGAMNERAKIGVVRKIIISPDEGRILGFTVKIGAILPKIKVVSFYDVIDIDANGVVIRASENLINIKDVVRIAELVEKRFSLIGLPVETKTKKSLGRVSDALVESQSGDILRLYVSSMFNRLVFEKSQIEKITLAKVIVKEERESKARRKVSLATEKATEPA